LLSNPRKTAKIKRVAIPTKGKISHPDKKKPNLRRLQRKRAGIEPVIGHLKSDHRMNRSRYTGFYGDQMNVSWAVIAWNTKKWVRKTCGCEKMAPSRGKRPPSEEKLDRIGDIFAPARRYPQFGQPKVHAEPLFSVSPN
jgi:hypothetical protein